MSSPATYVLYTNVSCETALLIHHGDGSRFLIDEVKVRLRLKKDAPVDLSKVKYEGPTSSLQLFFDVCHERKHLDSSDDLEAFMDVARVYGHDWIDDFVQIDKDVFDGANIRQVLEWVGFFHRYTDQSMFHEALKHLLQRVDEASYAVWHSASSDVQNVFPFIIQNLIKQTQRKDEELNDARSRLEEQDRGLEDLRSDFDNLKEQLDALKDSLGGV